MINEELSSNEEKLSIEISNLDKNVSNKKSEKSNLKNEISSKKNLKDSLEKSGDFSSEVYQKLLAELSQLKQKLIDANKELENLRKKRSIRKLYFRIRTW